MRKTTILSIFILSLICIKISDNFWSPFQNYFLPNSSFEKKSEYIAWFKTKESSLKYASFFKKIAIKWHYLENDFLYFDLKKADAYKLPQDKNLRIIKNEKLGIVPSSSIQKHFTQIVYQPNTFKLPDILALEKLRKQNESSDGRHSTIAIFDAGVDFDIRGISRNSLASRKLLGFYDFSGFGEIKLQKAKQVDSRLVSIDGKISTNLGVFKKDQINYISRISAKKLALLSGYFHPNTIHLNDKLGDTSRPFTIASNSHKAYFDLDNDGTLETELPDYNLSGESTRFLNSKSFAISIKGPGEVQIHSVQIHHGNSVASVAAGNKFGPYNRLGVAPASKLISYTLDPSGRNSFDLFSLVRSFIHASTQKVDVINISYLFAGATPESSQWLSEFINDFVITKMGVSVVFASGNATPSLVNAKNLNYIPNSALIIGGMLSPKGLIESYGWSGTKKEFVTSYSVAGRSSKGRLIPDLVAPVNSLAVYHPVIGEDKEFHWYGTSAAAPVISGSLASLISILKEEGLVSSPKLLKCALERSARKLPLTQKIRQGYGLPQLEKAYFIYKKLTTSENRNQVCLYNKNEKRVQGKKLLSLSKNNPISISSSLSLNKPISISFDLHAPQEIRIDLKPNNLIKKSSARIITILQDINGSVVALNKIELKDSFISNQLITPRLKAGRYTLAVYYDNFPPIEETIFQKINFSIKIKSSQIQCFTKKIGQGRQILQLSIPTSLPFTQIALSATSSLKLIKINQKGDLCNSFQRSYLCGELNLKDRNIKSLKVRILPGTNLSQSPSGLAIYDSQLQLLHNSFLQASPFYSPNPINLLKENSRKRSQKKLYFSIYKNTLELKDHNSSFLEISVPNQEEPSLSKLTLINQINDRKFYLVDFPIDEERKMSGKVILKNLKDDIAQCSF